MIKVKIIIAGGRNVPNDEEHRNLVKEKLRAWTDGLRADEVMLISGDAQGADQIGKTLAQEYGCNLLICPANWDEHGRRAGYLRNTTMAEEGTHLIALWDGKSRGTDMMINIAKNEQLEYTVIDV